MAIYFNKINRFRFGKDTNLLDQMKLKPHVRKWNNCLVFDDLQFGKFQLIFGRPYVYSLLIIEAKSI